MKLNKRFKNYRFYIGLPYMLLLLLVMLPFEILTKVFEALGEWCYALEHTVEFNLGKISGVNSLIRWIEENEK